MSRRIPPAAFTLVELLVVIAIIGLLVGLALPAIEAARESGRRAQCANNIRQIAIACQNFNQQTGGRLPNSSRRPGLMSGPRVSGLTLLLPYINMQLFYDRYDQSKDWFDAANLPVTSKRIEVFQCPSSPEAHRLDGIPEVSPWTPDKVAPTDYSPTLGVDRRLFDAGLVDAHGPGVLPHNGDPRLTHVIDGQSTTILYVESAARPFVYRRGAHRIGDLPGQRVNGGGWCRPASDISVDGATVDGGTIVGDFVINATNGEDFGGQPFPHPYYGTLGTGEVYAFHPGGAHVVFADGAVKFLDEKIRAREFCRLVTRAGQELVTLADY